VRERKKEKGAKEKGDKRREEKEKRMNMERSINSSHQESI